MLLLVVRLVPRKTIMVVLKSCDGRSSSKRIGKGLVGALTDTLRLLSMEAFVAHRSNVRFDLERAVNCLTLSSTHTLHLFCF